jgi:hypothetical protein
VGRVALFWKDNTTTMTGAYSWRHASSQFQTGACLLMWCRPP